MVKVVATLPTRPPVIKAMNRYVPGITSLISGSMTQKNVILKLKVKPSDLIVASTSVPAVEDTQTHIEPPSSSSTETNASTVKVLVDNSTSDLVIMTKVRAQQKMLRSDTIPEDKRSDCWWCAGSFENHPYYIPHSVVCGEALGYGSFCMPQCAVAYLHSEKGLDVSTLYERDHMINHYYGKPLDASETVRRRIVPAQDPKRLLERYYGTLTYPEYRRLCSSNYMFAPADRPITRVISELHDVIDPLVLAQFSCLASVGSNGYRVKMRTDTGTKSSNPLKNFKF